MSDSLSRSTISFLEAIAAAGNREFTRAECDREHLKQLESMNYVTPVPGTQFNRFRLSQDCLDFLLDRAEEKQRFEALEHREREQEEKQEKLHRQENRRSWIQFWITTGIAAAALIVSIIALMKSQ